MGNNARVLNGYPFVIIGPKNAILEMGEAEKVVRSENVAVCVRSFPNDDFANIAGYNTLLKSRRFLDIFDNTDLILSCQLDAVILSDELEKWLLRGFDFVGAPHFKGYSTPEMPPRLIPGANGGLSLRSVDASKRALDIVRTVKKTLRSKLVAWSGLPKLSNLLLRTKPWLLTKPNINEGISWSILIPSIISDYRVATPQIAAEFAFEVLPRYLFGMNSKALPFGCHAWQRYDQEYWFDMFPEKL